MVYKNNKYSSNIEIKYFLTMIIKNRFLISEMIKREILMRYKGSYLGIAWSFINPAIMLGLYTFVFSVIFKGRWAGANSENHYEFALILFIGMIAFNFFSEIISRSPFLVISNPNYVKKVVFPLEILPVALVGAGLFHACINFFIMIIFGLILQKGVDAPLFFIPLVFLPLPIMCLGFSWLLSSMSVYIRDIGQSIGFIVSALMFVCPVFYPLSAIPADYRWLILLNPPTFAIEQMRNIMIFGEYPNWYGLFVYYIISILILLIGFKWFLKTKKGFADIL